MPASIRTRRRKRGRAGVSSPIAGVVWTRTGLVGSTTDGEGYAFAMNTFQWAGALTPVARYDTRYAHDIGKWMLNLANAARLFYPGSLRRRAPVKL